MIYIFIALVLVHYILCIREMGIKRYIIPIVFGLMFFVGILSLMLFVFTPVSTSVVDPSVVVNNYSNGFYTGWSWIEYLIAFIHRQLIPLLVASIPLVITLVMSNKIIPNIGVLENDNWELSELDIKNL